MCANVEPGVVARSLSVGRAVVALLRNNYAPVVAGNVAFSAFVSIFPLLALAVAVTAALGGPDLVGRAVEGADPYLTRTAQGVLAESVANPSGRTGASVLSLGLLLWGALRVFRGLDVAFSLLYGTAHRTGFLGSLRDGLVVLVALTVALAVTAGVSAFVAFAPGDPIGPLTAPAVLVAGLALAFLPVYYVFPDADVTVREVAPGVLVAALGWAGLVQAFQFYASVAGRYEVYGAIGAVLLVLVWLYVAGMLLLTGAAVNVVLGGRLPPRGGSAAG